MTTAVKVGRATLVVAFNWPGSRGSSCIIAPASLTSDVENTMNTRFPLSIALCALITAVAIGMADESKSPKKELPIAVMSLNWQTPKSDTVCPSNSIVRNFSTEPCVIKATREPQMTVTLSPGETVYVGIEFRFQKVPDKVEMTTIPFETAKAAMERAKKRKE